MSKEKKEEKPVISGPADAVINITGRVISRSKAVLEPIEGDEDQSRIISRDAFQSIQGRATAVAEGVNQLGTVSIGPINVAAMVSPGIDRSPLSVEARFSGTLKLKTHQDDYLNESDLSLAGKVFTQSSIDEGSTEANIGGVITARMGQAG